jgi:predicted PurR-regulated permease PerM
MCKFWKKEKCNHHFPELNQRRQRLEHFRRYFSGARLTLIIVGMIAVLGLIYLTQTNTVATKGYQIRDLEQQLATLKEENKKLNLQYIEQQSIANISSQVAGLNLVPAGEVEIISPIGSTMALR